MSADTSPQLLARRGGFSGPPWWAFCDRRSPRPPYSRLETDLSIHMTMSETTFLTPEAHAKLQAELEELRTEGRAHIEARIQEAREHGDIRENADYDAAKNDQGLMEARIRQIENLLAHAVVSEVADTGEVVVGSLVSVLDTDGDETEYFVAPPENRQPGYLLASPSGPLGRALLGARPGDEVSYEAPGGTFTVTVRSIRPFRG